MDENSGGLLTGVKNSFSAFFQSDLLTLGLTVIFVVTVAVLWARGPLENITHHLRES